MHSADNYSLHNYGQMINDRRRSGPFVEALRTLIKPDTVVLEIGTAAGYFALLCAKLGARRIYAVEPDNAIEVARLCAADNVGSDRITWIKGLSTEISLPERVDLVLGDLHGTLPFYNHNIESMVDARQRHLKLGGTIVPMRDVMRVVPAQAPHEYAKVESPWGSNPDELTLSAGRSFVANRWWRAAKQPANTSDLLAPPAIWGTIDYRTATSSNLDGTMQWTVQGAGNMHGYYVWFDGELTDGIGYSNAPDHAELVYGRAFFPLEHPIEVSPGDVIDTRFSAHSLHGRHLIRWNTRVTDANGFALADYRQSTFRSEPVDRGALERTAPDHVPQLDLSGHIDLAILAAMAQGKPLSQIAEAIHTAYPGPFATHAKALERVVRLSLKYGTDAPSRSGTCD
ncbi:MAG: 50S ribosomal protein L11 methyltransferase [Thermomonas sp.]|uniref:50S ribosomal protein L11 methyltransferase n=1 Tax=Thermomonas sp. TaxID=1971895 RepID=UPI0025E74322|nr:class I SAM-dependent methyltransferase [Thermomonas sp.]MBK6924782.1 50S ribosomal protein L11 methyltransferase [Thermomonas sp.]